MKTMDEAKQMIEDKFNPKASAKSISPFLMANAVGFDSIKMLNKMEEDRQEREARQERIRKEL